MTYPIVIRGLRVAGPEVLRARERQALEINDSIVQGLTRVKWALEAKRPEEAHAAADEALAQAQKMVTDLLVAHSERGLHGRRLYRQAPRPE